ncbi:class I SAM-dependent methyltransferase, partial [Patescibacteria group bacterium]|nr:class I SAM-dependent methyltransferase [Patescibacteria group bacterium]MBU1868795.1 class I SAM-dependent methyltransferase [Patescibacteria group bacterium]
MFRTFLKGVDRAIFGYFYDEFYRILEKEIIGCCDTLLDVGCGTNSPIQRFSGKLGHSVGVDISELVEGEGFKKIHDEYKIMNALRIGEMFAEDSFDCVLASDVIEHLFKDDGLKLISLMEKIARKKVIVFTPNGFLSQDLEIGNRYQAHLSGWNVDEMKSEGYRVVGINGWRALRGKKAYVHLWPRLFWERVS